jgi:hypothetical protein
VREIEKLFQTLLEELVNEYGHASPIGIILVSCTGGVLTTW